MVVTFQSVGLPTQEVWGWLYHVIAPPPLFFFFSFFCLLSFFVVVVVVAFSWAAPEAYGGSQARG